MKLQHSMKALLTYSLSTFLLKGIGFLTTPLFTRLLSIGEYGNYSIFTTWVSLFSVFIGLQVSASIPTARIYRENNNFDLYLRNISVLSLISAVCISLLCILFRNTLTSLLKISQGLVWQLVIQAFGVSCVTFYSTYTIQTKQAKKNGMFSVLVTLSITLLGLLFVLKAKENKDTARIFATTLSYIVIIPFVLKKFKTFDKKKINYDDWKFCLSLSIPLIMHLLSNIIIGQSSRIFLKALINEDKAAIYTVAATVASITIIVADVCNNVWSPWYLENTKYENNEKINEIAIKYMNIIALIFSLLIIISPEIFAIMAPPEYKIGNRSVLILTAGNFFVFLYRFPLGFEQYSKNMKWVAVCTIISALANMGLNYFLINSIGFEGASIASLISYIILFGLHEVVARKIIKNYNIRFRDYINAIIICGIFFFLSYIFLDYQIIRFVIFTGLMVFLIYKVLKDYRNVRLDQE